MFNVFNPVPVAYAVAPADALPPASAAYERDAITLGWDERLKTRGIRRSDKGFEFATALGRGTVLQAGHCFVFDEPPIVVRVVERDEPVMVIRPRTAREWAVFGYHIGNSHQPVMVTDDEIVCAELPGMEQVLRAHAIPFSRATRPFTPIGQASNHRHEAPG